MSHRVCKLKSNRFCYVCGQLIFAKKDSYRNVLKQHLCIILDFQWIIKIKSGPHMFFVKAVGLLLSLVPTTCGLPNLNVARGSYFWACGRFIFE